MRNSTTWQELVSQPARWRALGRRAPAPTSLWREISAADQVVLFGSGSSYYLAASAGDAIELVTGRRVLAVPSCEIMLDPDRTLPATDRPRVAIGFSRSGESSEVVEATAIARQRGLSVLGVTCSEASTLAREANEALIVPEGHEDGLVMLRSFTCMLLACGMALGAGALGERDPAAALEQAAASGEALLQAFAEPVTALANSRPFNRFVLLGSGADHALAQEAALKLQEMATVTTEPYYTLEYRHGPRSTGDENTLAVLFATRRADLGTSLVRDLSGQGLATMVIGDDTEAYRGLATIVVPVGTASRGLAGQVLKLLPAQLLAVATAERTGQNPDAPRNLAKVVLL